MPMYEYQCNACHADFERLVRGDAVPTCPECGSADLTKVVSRLAPAGKIEAIRLSNRRAADAQGAFSNYSPADRARLLKGKNV